MLNVKCGALANENYIFETLLLHKSDDEDRSEVSNYDMSDAASVGSPGSDSS
jgi:hypothetical protein